MQSGVMDTTPSDKILHCLQQLTETRDYIRQKEHELQQKEVQFRLEMQQKEFDLKCAKSTHDQRVAASKEELAEEWGELEETKKRAEEIVIGDDKTHIVELNVGGDKFSTDLRTLQHQEGSIFPRLVQKFDLQRRPTIHVFIDRDSRHFRFILNYMRQGEEVFRCTALRSKDALDLEEMICEARYYKLNGFMKLLERHRVRLVHKLPASFMNLLNEKYFKAPTLQNQPFETTKRLDLKRLNMEGVEFVNVHFKHVVSFEGSIMTRAKFKNCRFDAIVDFTDAEMSDMCFEHCIHAAPDRFRMDGKEAEKCRVKFNPPVNLKNFSVFYRNP